MSIIHLSAVASEEPSSADLAGIETEWPLIAAELDLLDAQIALINAAEARWIAPFSGPIQRNCCSPVMARQKPRMSDVIDSSVLPTTIGARALMAATHTSVPRPSVKVSPWPSRPSSASVFRTT